MTADVGVNVKVAVRARPLNSREKGLDCKECIEMNGNVTKITDPDTGREREFAFDFSYWYDTTQQTVYQDLAKPIVEGAIDGFNGVIFAYGQTGSGKTHSMMGSGDDIGIVPQMNRELFDLLNSKKDKDGGECLVTASYMEMYNEVIRDLLNPSDKQLKIREHPKLGIYVEQLAELVVEDAETIASLLEQGNTVKQVAATQMNERSSRSHCCFVVNIKQRKVEEVGEGDERAKRETTLSAKINLVDLAGSERASKTGAEGSRLKEGAAINQSLSTLGQVINMLAEGGGKHIPYRNSKLTRVLQQALGGNAKTVMIAAISPADNNYQETLSTLQYASRAKKIKNTTHRNEDVNQKMIRELREEVERLRAAMAAIEQGERPSTANGDAASPEAEEEMKKMQETIAMLEETKKRQWDEVQKLSKAYEEERSKILKNENLVRDLMQNVKEEKVAHLKRLQELEIEKVLLTKSLKQTKADYTRTKSKLESEMKLYQELTSVPQEKQDENEIQKVFSSIEANRDFLVSQREQMKSLKDQVKRNQEEQIEQKAEIEAQKALLEEDADLRKAIQEEERNKLFEEIKEHRDELITKEIEEEKTKLEGKVFSQMQSIEKKYQRKLTVSQALQVKVHDRSNELELKVIDLNCDNRLLKKEIRRLKNKLAAQNANHEREIKRMEKDHKMTLKRLLKAFEKDQGKLMQALHQVSQDCVQLYEEKCHLEGGF